MNMVRKNTPTPPQCALLTSSLGSLVGVSDGTKLGSLEGATDGYIHRDDKYMHENIARYKWKHDQWRDWSYVPHHLAITTAVYSGIEIYCCEFDAIFMIRPYIPSFYSSSYVPCLNQLAFHLDLRMASTTMKVSQMALEMVHWLEVETVHQMAIWLILGKYCWSVNKKD